MAALRGYAIAIGWVACFLLVAALARLVFDLIVPFSLRDASAQRSAAIGRVLRGLYIGLAAILGAAVYSTESIGLALRDGAVGVALMLAFFKLYALVDRRDLARELGEGNSMLGMELEGLLILLAALIVGALNLLGR
jgi:uncharacterized membrane protein YjfL (UPF0719 family)